MIRRLAVAVSLVALVGCSMPTTTVKTSDTRPGFAIEGAPDGAVLYVDGVRVGEANRYDGQPDVLLVEPGTHTVAVRAPDGAPLYERKVYVESELKTIKVH